MSTTGFWIDLEVAYLIAGFFYSNRTNIWPRGRETSRERDLRWLWRELWVWWLFFFFVFFFCRTGLCYNRGEVESQVQRRNSQPAAFRNRMGKSGAALWRWLLSLAKPLISCAHVSVVHTPTHTRARGVCMCVIQRSPSEDAFDNTCRASPGGVEIEM